MTVTDTAVTRQRAPQIDPWSFYDYKTTFFHQKGPHRLHSWIGSDNIRRQLAYMFLESLYRNSAREWLDPENVDEEDKRSRREYGDPYVIVQTDLASLIGDSQHIVVPEADGDDPPEGSRELEDLLQKWADDEKFIQKIIEGERNSIRLGDNLYVLQWDNENDRPCIHVWDPGFYFPVLDPRKVSQFPDKVHLAYEYEETDTRGEVRRYLRRVTWELKDMENGATQTLPWNTKPTQKSCFYTDATWNMGDFRGNVYDLAPENAVYAIDEDSGEELRDFDLDIDFIPAVHVPNNVAGQDHFGTSALANVVQILEDLVSTDTDLQATSAITGSPPIGINGAGLPTDDKGRIAAYGPGSVFQTGDGGMTILDTSNSLDALIKYDDHQLSRLAVNARIPESLLGKIKPNEVPSGITLTLSFTPHTSMVREMRLVREDKYGLLTKMVTRFYMKYGTVKKFFKANVKFGSFLPADKSEAVDLARQLYQGDHPLVSLETAVRILMNAGFPIDDAVEEVRRIRENDFEQANKALDATGDLNYVRRRLGLPELPTDQLPPTPSPGGPAPVAGP